jgi:glycosyltransferase involved in cell wall biosynthesis
MLTVLLATRNRAHFLPGVLDALCALKSPTGGWKLVIVDNGSTDQTEQVLASYSGRLPLHSIVERKLGKNSALNAGLALVEGDLTILSDDDVFPRSDWLAQMRRAADEQPGYTIFGGAIKPRWEVVPPEWTKWIDLGPIFTITSPLLKEGEISFEALSVVQGPNMAVRSTVLQSTLFNPSIGPRGASYPMGSETELVLRLGRQGHKAWHVQEAVVEHYVRSEQLNEDWVLERAIRLGRGRYRMSPHVKLWLGVPRHLFRDVPREVFLIAITRLLFKKPAHFRSRWRLNILRGKALEARLMAGEARIAATETQSTG